MTFELVSLLNLQRAQTNSLFDKKDLDLVEI